MSKKKDANRRMVPCECRQCGSIRTVSQGDRRLHLARQNREDRAKAVALKTIASQIPPDQPPFTAEELVDAIAALLPPPLQEPVPELPKSSTTYRDLEQQMAPALELRPPSPLSNDVTMGEPGFPSPEDTEMGEATPGVWDGIPEVEEIPLCDDDDWESRPDPWEAGPRIGGDDEPSEQQSVSPVPPLRPPPPPAPPMPETQAETPYARYVPLSKEQENDPDPFLGPKATTPSAPAPKPSDIHPQPGIYMLYMLAAWLHLQFHLPFRACGALVSVVLIIIRSFGTVIEGKPLVTLQRIIPRLDIEPTFDILPICPACWEVYPSGPDTPSNCRKCSSPMFKSPDNAGSTFEKRKPLLQGPSMSLQAQLASILSIPGVEAELDKWREKKRTPGRYTDIFDGAVTKELPAPDGSPFFRNEERDRGRGELRIGLTLGLDWFSYLRSQIAPSHTSAPLSYSIANLPAHHWYRTANLLLVGILPGPKEQAPDECHRFLRITVNELLRLWKDGFTAITESCPRGRLVRVILICICCDKPAAHKVGGFAGHSHTFFCTRCWIKQTDKGSPEAYKPNAFAPRTDAEQRYRGYEYTELKSDSSRDAFVKEHATRWTEFARLPYFNPVRHVVVDPMHNLFLGLVKTHFHHIWVQGKILRPKHELSQLQQLLREFEMPAFLGRLPAHIGESAGGSLTADQWLILATVAAPVVLPLIWGTHMVADRNVADTQRQASIQARIKKAVRAKEAEKAKTALRQAAKAAQKKAEAEVKAVEKGAKKGTKGGTKRGETSTEAPAVLSATPLPLPPPGTTVPEPEEEDIPNSLHPDDIGNFLKLSKALQILLKRDISDQDIDNAEGLLCSYCTKLLTLYGQDVMKPNHHYCVHTGDCIRDFGPVHEFWTFLFERLNKVLKSFNTNNHSGGELETTFFREFHRMIGISRAVACSTINDDGGMFKEATAAMFAASADDRGTLQALAKELDEEEIDRGVVFTLSPRFRTSRMPDDMYRAVLKFARAVFPTLNLRSLAADDPQPGSIPLSLQANYYDYVVQDGRRYMAATRSSPNSNTFVEAIVHGDRTTCVGQLVDIMEIVLPDKRSYTFGHFRWLRPMEELGVDIEDTVWAASSSLGVKLWYEGKPAPAAVNVTEWSTLLPLYLIQHHVAVSRVATSTGIPALVTINIEK